MAMYRKKPVVIEAMQFRTNNDDGSHINALVQWIRDGGGNAAHNNTDIDISTLEGTMRATVGDWVIRGVKGEFYPCKPDIFEATYSVVV